MADLWNQTTYITKTPLILGSSIYEYDIRAANVSILRAAGRITDNIYNNYLLMDKQTREVSIGMIQKEEKKETGVNITGEIIKEGIKEAKRLLFLSNNIQNENVVRIANDAVYVECSYPYNSTTFDIFNNGKEVWFKTKGPYHGMVKLPHNVLFYTQLEEGYDVEVIGIKNDMLSLHTDMLGFICEVLVEADKIGKSQALRSIGTFYEDYINLKLPLGYYRNFNSESTFKFKNSPFAAKFLSSEEVSADQLDINYNILVIRQLYKAILDWRI